jgi:hypothetical protein
MLETKHKYPRAGFWRRYWRSIANEPAALN